MPKNLVIGDIDVFRSNFDDHEMDFSKLESAIREFTNPEDINSNPNLAPSKRLIEAISGYEKVVYGSCLAEEIGLESIMERCPLFSQWFSTLRSI